MKQRSIQTGDMANVWVPIMGTEPSDAEVSEAREALKRFIPRSGGEFGNPHLVRIDWDADAGRVAMFEATYRSLKPEKAAAR